MIMFNVQAWRTAAHFSVAPMHRLFTPLMSEMFEKIKGWIVIRVLTRVPAMGEAVWGDWTEGGGAIEGEVIPRRKHCDTKVSPLVRTRHTPSDPGKDSHLQSLEGSHAAPLCWLPCGGYEQRPGSAGECAMQRGATGCWAAQLSCTLLVRKLFSYTTTASVGSSTIQNRATGCSECTAAYRACCSPLSSPGWEEQRPSPSSSFRTFVFRLERSERHKLQGSGWKQRVWDTTSLWEPFMWGPAKMRFSFLSHPNPPHCVPLGVP